MTQLHANFHLRNLKGFRQLLLEPRSSAHNAPPPGAAGNNSPRSWQAGGAMASAFVHDPNTRDHLGRTPLHLACASNEPYAIDFVTTMLAHSHVNINLADAESHWTPLHRALYAGNLAAAVLLLQRADIDIEIKDKEGYTAFDLYNSTVEGTKPEGAGPRQLFTWGANRNSTLGVGGGDDRTYPEYVHIPQIQGRDEKQGTAKLQPVMVNQIEMAKLHTVVVTAESKCNLRVCGFGSGGRLGQGQHTVLALTPLPSASFSHRITSVALGQDHTLALTAEGDVLSWGLNRFLQLGYVIESSASRGEELVQGAPRRILGVLKKERVIGVAACKSASACWTDKDVFTWGTNNGQLGYTKATQPTQVLPRKVTFVSQPIIGLSITESAMACLLDSQEILCFWNDAHFKINFPMQRFPSEFSIYRPPQAVGRPCIAKVTSCDASFAALSTLGDVFLFSLPPATELEKEGKDKWADIKPQRVWALRKQHSAVKDVSLGADGSMILCTKSGHVFVRTRNFKAASSTSSGALTKSFKFHRVPFLQRVVKVCANSTGAFAAIRMDAQRRSVAVTGNTLAEALDCLLTHVHASDRNSEPGLKVGVDDAIDFDSEDDFSDTESDTLAIELDIAYCRRLLAVLEAEPPSVPWTAPLHSKAQGADILLTSGRDIPAHRSILLTRCPALRSVLKGEAIKGAGISVNLVPKSHTHGFPHLAFQGCHTMTVYLLLQYLYTDNVAAIWDRRVGSRVARRCSRLDIRPMKIKEELRALAKVLHLGSLADALDRPVKCVPTPSLSNQFEQLFLDAQKDVGLSGSALGDRPIPHDVEIELADKTVACHSAVLRAQSPFFAGFFGTEDWTARRWGNGILRVNAKHLEWQPMSYVFLFMCCGRGEEIFDNIDFVSSADELVNFLFLVMACANEFLLDKLVLICSSAILKYVNVTNVCPILANAMHFHASQLVQSLQSYMAKNMECLLECRLLDGAASGMIKQLSEYVRVQQAEKHPISRSNTLGEQALRNNAEWLALQDIPQPIIRSAKVKAIRASPKAALLGIPAKGRSIYLCRR
ncbi:hypothetical protein BOTBODRAFT_245013 [Botryobasidium botryosum FD-172 SS1]|uniref:Uncharacterized protein n=1 Tax=Botryobasidium botryosum (strain FD-172 SS1) TaxID=930990 RepID=A0A067LWF3_BOTB1|nr:hypothetical protein BOTBODRAFT_245013 [Botryobasidium botryosum FD-172 SS1]